jgi:ATP-dependent DNA helicase RecG
MNSGNIATEDQLRLALFDNPDVGDLLTRREDQWLERKSFRVAAPDLANSLIGFANADGGRLIVGVRDGKIEGVNSDVRQLSALLQASLDFCEPPVRHEVNYLDCVSDSGEPDRLLILDITASSRIHRNKKGVCYLRRGDENRQLRAGEERELAIDKSEMVYDQTPVPHLTLADLDPVALNEYARKMKVSSLEGLLHSRALFYSGPERAGVTHAGWLLFGKTPPLWSYVRYLRYDGTTAETGTRSNLLQDIRLEGTIPALIEQAKNLLATELEVIRLTPSGQFQRVRALPEFAWLEAIVNAVTHRSYSLQGDGIRVTQFSDRLEVQSPGRFPGLVRVENIRDNRCARNPSIARVLTETTDYVREMNEGVKRMFREMEEAGLPQPAFRTTDSSVIVTLYKMTISSPENTAKITSHENEIARYLDKMRKRLGDVAVQKLLSTFYAEKQMATRNIADILECSKQTALTHMQQWEKLGIVSRTGKSVTDPASLWVFRSSTKL